MPQKAIKLAFFVLQSKFDVSASCGFNKFISYLDFQKQDLIFENHLILTEEFDHKNVESFVL